MTREKSCGALVFRREAEGGKTYIALIRHRHGRYFSFPKGHMEKGESEIMTAEREVLEETALKIHITSDFRCTVNYHPSYGVEKEVVYFLTETDQVETCPREGEIERVDWVPIERAERVLTHENDKRVFRRALAEMEKNHGLHTEAAVN